MLFFVVGKVGQNLLDFSALHFISVDLASRTGFFVLMKLIFQSDYLYLLFI